VSRAGGAIHEPRDRPPGRYAATVNITVVGAGVIGLTTALALEERGHDVRVVAAGVEDATTSAIAGACWFPYRAGPPDRVAGWRRRSAIRTRGLSR